MNCDIRKAERALRLHIAFNILKRFDIIMHEQDRHIYNNIVIVLLVLFISASPVLVPFAGVYSEVGTP
jgi:hypothetical protein